MITWSAVQWIAMGGSLLHCTALYGSEKVCGKLSMAMQMMQGSGSSSVCVRAEYIFTYVWDSYNACTMHAQNFFFFSFLCLTCFARTCRCWVLLNSDQYWSIMFELIFSIVSAIHSLHFISCLRTPSSTSQFQGYHLHGLYIAKFENEVVRLRIEDLVREQPNDAWSCRSLCYLCMLTHSNYTTTKL